MQSLANCSDLGDIKSKLVFGFIASFTFLFVIFSYVIIKNLYLHLCALVYLPRQIHVNPVWEEQTFEIKMVNLLCL